MNNWFVSKKLSFETYEYISMQLLHEFSYNEQTEKTEDNGRGKIVLIPKDQKEGYGNNNLEMIFLTYEEAAAVKQEFDDYLNARDNTAKKNTVERAFAGGGSTLAKG